MTTTPPTAEQVREFVLNGHGNLARVQEMLAAQPELLNMAHEWRENDTETALQAAAHVGNREIAEYLLNQGAPLEICTAAMLGRREAVMQMLSDSPELLHATGAHGIPLLTHASLSGDVELVQALHQQGVSGGASMALNLAAMRGDTSMVDWLLAFTAPDLTWKNWQGKTAAELAAEGGYEELAARLRGE